MSITTCQAIKFALIPCEIEKIEDESFQEGSMGLNAIAQGVRVGRDGLYLGILLTTVASVALTIIKGLGLSLVAGTILMGFAGSIAGAGTALILISICKLYTKISSLSNFQVVSL